MAKGRFTVSRGSARFGRTQFGDGFGLAFDPDKNTPGFVQVHRPTLVQISAWLRAANPADPAIRDWLADLFWGGIKWERINQGRTLTPCGGKSQWQVSASKT